VLALLAGSLLPLANCGGSGSGTFNPTPSISSVFPAIITAGSDDFTLFISGVNFQTGSGAATFAFWNGVPLSTVFNSSTTQLQASVPASFVTTPNVVQITLMNPAPGGGTSNSVSFTIEPLVGGAPTITLPFVPANVNAGAGAFTLTVNGSNFTVNDVVTFNGNFLTTTFVNSNRVTAPITSDDVASAGFASVAVLDTVSGIIASPSVKFEIMGSDNPKPGISSLSPSTATPGGPDFELIINGSNFVQTSSVMWNATPLATSFIKGGQLAAWVPASLIAASGSVDVTVFNPAPGGGTSQMLTFTIH
jgi:hypothetical protein